MSVPIQKFSDPHDDIRQTLIASVERAIEKYLHHRAGEALTRQEIGVAFTQMLADKAGLGRDANAREQIIAILQLVPSVAELMKNGTDLIDRALTNLVRRRTVHMALLDTQPHFWPPDQRPALP